MARLPLWPIECLGCGHSWQSRAAGGVSVRCPASQGGCGKPRKMPRDRPLTAAEAGSSAAPSITAARQLPGGPDRALVQAWARVPEWTDADDAIMWRPDPKAGSCESCGGICVAEPGRTLVCCPACDWWADYPEVIAWRERQHGSASPAAGREPRLTRAELDAASRELHIRRGRVLAVIGKVLADDKLTVDCRSVFAWYQDRVSRAVPGGDMDEGAMRKVAGRLDELEEQLAAERVQRRGFWRPDSEAADYLDDDGGQELDDDDDGQELDDVPRARAIAGPDPRSAVTTARPAGGPLCEWCIGTGQQVPAVARIVSPQVPGMIPERDVCLEHFDFYAEIAAPMTYANLEVRKRYASVPRVRSIIKVGQLAALNGSPR